MKREIRGIICLFLAMLMAASCSDNSKMKGLLEQVPADADVVLVGSVKTVLESAGGKLENSQIILPAFISDNLSQGEKKDFDEANAFLKDSGIDPEACAVIGYLGRVGKRQVLAAELYLRLAQRLQWRDTF